MNIRSLKRMPRRILGLLLATLLISVGLAAPAQAYSYDFSVCSGTQPQQEISRECLALMESFPEPSVLEIRDDRWTLSNYAFWKVNNPGAPLFDGPGGNVIRNFDNGFNFVRVLDTDSVAGWVQVEGGWMPDAEVTYVAPSFFKGVQLLDGLKNQFAWVLGDLYTSSYPGGSQDKDNGRLLFRYTRVNLFAEAYDENGWRWYMIGPDQWIEQRMVGKPVKTERPEGYEGRWVAVDLYEQTLVAYENDTPVFATLIASGLPGSETREGVFTVWAALERDRMSGAMGDRLWDLQSVPWVMYFDDSISLHGTYWHDNFGYRRSRGCVNLSISDARYVFEWMADGGTRDDITAGVLVWSSGEYRSTGAATK
jgi:hypothetical protein